LRLLLIGHGNYLPHHHVVGIYKINTKPVKRLISKKGQENKLVDAADGKRRKSLLITFDDYAILSSISPAILKKRFKEGGGNKMDKIISINNENYLPVDKILSITQVKSEPIKKLVEIKRKDEEVIDATNGKRTKSIILTTNNYFILSSLTPESLAGRVNKEMGFKCMINLGYYNFLNSKKIEVILDINSRPSTRLIDKSKSMNQYINVCMGRKKRSIIFTELGHIYSSSNVPSKLASRYFSAKEEKEK
jgi:extracellular matrix regulatory protein A